MDKAMLRNIPKVDELLAPTHALCPDASAAAVSAEESVTSMAGGSCEAASAAANPTAGSPSSAAIRPAMRYGFFFI